MTAKDDRGPFTLQRIQKLSRTYGSSVRSDVLYVQGLINDAFVTFTFAGGDEASLAELKTSPAV